MANAEQIIAGELLLAAQALSLVEPLTGAHPLGRGTQAALDAVRAVIPPALEGDRWYQTDMASALDLVRANTVVEAVENVTGPLD